MGDEARYTIAELREIIGCSDSWIRKKLRAGLLGEVERVYDRRGYAYRFTADQIDRAQILYRGKGSSAGGVEPSPTRGEMQAMLVRSAAEIDKWRGISEAHEQSIARLEKERDAERERLEAAQKRIEDLKSLSVVDRLLGKHKSL